MVQRKRQKRDDFFEEDDDDDGGVLMMGNSEEERESEEEPEEDVETAEEKRLRLAKQYLSHIEQLNEEHDEGGVAEILRQDALESMGHLRRVIADRVVLPEVPVVAAYDRRGDGGKLYRGHRLSVTAVALTRDDAKVFSVSKDGSIMELDVESGKRQAFSQNSLVSGDGMAGGGAPWMTPAARQGSRTSLLAAAVSSDGKYLAVGGGDRKVHIWDARSRQLIRSFPGHKDAVSALSFRQGTHQLFSGSLDRSLYIWSLEDMTYVDTLFGHQSPILGLDSLQGDRALTCGADRTCRVWKIPEESQLVFRGNCVNIEACAYITSSEWVTGDGQGSVQLWNSAKKKPTYTCRNAHVADIIPDDSTKYVGAGSIGGDACSWVGSVAVCPGSDLIASGAGDGAIQFWKVWDGGKGDGGRRALENKGAIPVRGFVNSLAIASSARFVVAGMGQEPRMGRWLRDPAAKNGVFIRTLDLKEDA